MHTARNRITALSVAVTVLAGCTAARTPTTPPTGRTSGSTSGSTSGPASFAATCAPAHQLDRGHGFPELHGAGTASLYGLVMATHYPARVGDELKIVWRMTGRGPVRFWATGPADQRVPLVWGPDLHLGSNYDRPGLEWGTGYRFPAPGCWHLHARRQVGYAVAALRVVPRA